MPEPISSSNKSTTAGSAPDPTLDPEGLVCRSEPPPASRPPLSSEASLPPPAVSKLVSAVPPPAAKLPPAVARPASSEAQNNAQRTTELPGIVAGYADYGVTGGDHDSLFAGVAALKGRDPKSGIELEVFTASAQVGAEHELQAGMARVGVSGKNGGITVDIFTARANEGVHNDDGSLGINLGGVVNLANVEVTLSHGMDSVTLGLGIGMGAALSVGIRTDEDGSLDKCIKATVGPLTAGVCLPD